MVSLESGYGRVAEVIVQSKKQGHQEDLVLCSDLQMRLLVSGHHFTIKKWKVCLRKRWAFASTAVFIMQRVFANMYYHHHYYYFCLCIPCKNIYRWFYDLLNLSFIQLLKLQSIFHSVSWKFFNACSISIALVLWTPSESITAVSSLLRYDLAPS